MNYTDENGAENLHKWLIKQVNLNKVISEGLDWDQLGKLAFKTVDHLENVLTVKREFIRYPIPDFWSSGDYFNLLYNHLGSGVAVIGLEKPEPHWSIIIDIGEDHVRFYDSTYLPEKVYFFDIGLVKDRKKPEEDYAICPHQVLLFRRRGEDGPEIPEKGKKQLFPAEDRKAKRY